MIDWGVVGTVIALIVGAAGSIGYLSGSFKRGRDDAARQDLTRRTDALEAALGEAKVWRDRAQRQQEDIATLTAKISHLEAMVVELKAEVAKRDGQIAELKALLMMEKLPPALSARFDSLESIILRKIGGSKDAGL